MDFDIVIPSIKEDVRTLESIPDGIPTHVVREGSINEARNIGVKRARSDTIIIMDDDLAFSEETLYNILDKVNQDTLVGMAEETVGLILGRVMAFTKGLWKTIGGFDERLRSHNGDTDFAIKAKKSGFQIERFPQTWFDHKEHNRSVTPFDRIWRIAYLSIKHPRWSYRIIDSFILQPHLPWARFWSR